MSIYSKSRINKLELRNAGGFACWLECCYKVGESGEIQRVGDTGSFPIGESKDLALNELDIPNGAWVTA